MVNYIFGEVDYSQEVAKFDFEYVQTLNLPIKTSHILIAHARDRYLDFLTSPNKLEKSLEDSLTSSEKPYTPKRMRGICTSLGILAEHLELYDFAEKLFLLGSKSGSALHARWLASGKGIESLISKIDSVEQSEQIVNIFASKKKLDVVRKLKIRSRELCIKHEKYTRAAFFAARLGNFDLALEDVRKLFERETKFISFKEGKAVWELGRYAKRVSYKNYTSFFDFAIKFYSEKKSFYSVARLHWETGRRKEAAEFFRKAKCFERCLMSKKSAGMKISRPIAKNLVEQQLIIYEMKRNQAQRLGNRVAISPKDILEEMKKPISRARRYGVEDFLFGLIKDRFMLNTAYCYAKKLGEESYILEMEDLLNQSINFESLISEDIWDSVMAPNFFRKHVDNDTRWRIGIDYMVKLDDIQLGLGEKIVNLWEEQPDDNLGVDINIFAHLPFNKSLLNALTVKKYFEKLRPNKYSWEKKEGLDGYAQKNGLEEVLAREKLKTLCKSVEYLLKKGKNAFLEYNISQRDQ